MDEIALLGAQHRTHGFSLVAANEMRVLCLFAVLALAAALPRSGNFEEVDGYTFAEYVADFDKVYSSIEDYQAHEAVFNANLAKIIAHNQDSTQSWCVLHSFFLLCLMFCSMEIAGRPV